MTDPIEDQIRAIYPDGIDRDRARVLAIASLAKANAELGALFLDLALREPAKQDPPMPEPQPEPQPEPIDEAWLQELDAAKATGRVLAATLEDLRFAWNRTQGGKARMGELVGALRKAFGDGPSGGTIG